MNNWHILAILAALVAATSASADDLYQGDYVVQEPPPVIQEAPPALVAPPAVVYAPPPAVVYVPPPVYVVPQRYYVPRPVVAFRAYPHYRPYYHPYRRW